jgi:hypothetical protein
MSRKKQSEAIDLWDNPVEQDSGEYVVIAGINKKTDRQLYLSTYEDCDDWSISIVPSIMTYSRATKMVNKATKELENNKKLELRWGKPEFKIVPFLK